MPPVTANISIHGPADCRSGTRLCMRSGIGTFLPENGRALSDYACIPPTRDDDWRIPVPATPASFGITDPQDAAWVGQRLSNQPLGTFTQPAVARPPGGSASVRRAPGMPVPWPRLGGHGIGSG